MSHRPCDARLRNRQLVGLVSLGVALGACRESPVGTGGSGGNGGGNGAGPRISVLATVPQPTHVVARNGAVYWLEASDKPLNALSLATGAHTTLFQSLPIPESALSDGSYVYWVSGGRLFRTTVDGTATTVLDSGQRDAGAGVTAQIEMDATHLYWANSISSANCSPACKFTIRQIPKPGGTATTLATTSQAIVALAVRGGDIYWEEVGIGPASADGTVGSQIKKVPIAGGTVTVLVDGLLNGLIAPPGPGWIPASWHPTGGIALDDSTVYFADASFYQSYRVMKEPATGGPLTILVADTTGDASDFARDMLLDASNLYWADANSIKTVPKAGGGYHDLASNLPSPVRLARVAANLYWLQTRCCAHGDTGSVWTIPTAGGTPVTLKAGLDSPSGMAADASNLFWIEGGPIGGIEHFGSLSRMALDGSGALTLVESAGGGPFDVDDTYVYFGDGFTIKRVPVSGGPVVRLVIGYSYVTGVATDGVYVYWVEDAGYSIVRKIPVGGGPVTTLASGPGPAGAIRIDALQVYWMGGERTISRVPKTGGAPSVVVDSVTMTDFVVDKVNLYYAEWDGGRIRKVPVAGGAVTTLAYLRTDQTRRLATDAVTLYWIDQTSVMKVPVTQGSPQYIVSGVASDPFLISGITVDDKSVYWAEVAGGVIKMATPK